MNEWRTVFALEVGEGHAVRVAAMGAVDWETLEALEGYVKLCRNRGIGELSGEEKGGQSEKVRKLEVAATMAEQEAAEYRAQWESVHAAADELRMRLKARDGEITVLEFQCEELARQLAEARSATMLPVASTANGAVSKPAEVVEVDNAGPAAVEDAIGKLAAEMLRRDTQEAKIFKVLVNEGPTRARELAARAGIPAANLYANCSSLKRKKLARFADGVWSVADGITTIVIKRPDPPVQDWAKARFRVLVTLMENRGMTLLALVGRMGKFGVPEREVREVIEDCERLGYVSHEGLALSVEPKAAAKVEHAVREYEERTGKVLDRQVLQES